MALPRPSLLLVAWMLPACLPAAEVQTVTVTQVAVLQCTAAQSQSGLCPRPPPLAIATGCTDWEGTVSGNDPSVQVRIQLCDTPDGVRGRFQWSSVRSGWSERILAGTWSDNGATLVLRDTDFAASQPAPGWRFCLVDRYVLERVAPDRLRGYYDSAECQDHAVVDLQRVR